MLFRKLHDRSPIVDFVNKQALAMFENQARKGLIVFVFLCFVLIESYSNHPTP